MFIFNLFVLALKALLGERSIYVIIDVNYTLEVIHWSSQMKFNREILREEAWNNSGFDTVWTKAPWVFIVECSTNWTKKPHTRNKPIITPLVAIIPWTNHDLFHLLLIHSCMGAKIPQQLPSLWHVTSESICFSAQLIYGGTNCYSIKSWFFSGFLNSLIWNYGTNIFMPQIMSSW